MVPKRHFSTTIEDGQLGLGGVPVQESKRRQTFPTVVRDVMKGLYTQEFLSNIEPLLRRVVREELERVILPLLHSFPRSSLNRIDSTGSRGWQLHFRKKLPHTLFTNTRIESEYGAPIEIVVLDANSKRLVTTGPISYAKVEILVLDGDFGSDGKEDWSQEEFDACVIREREGKRPLVTGDRQITIRDGVGSLGDITFTDNSSWTRSGTFRLGARIVHSSSRDEGIREARSEAFKVRDHRGVLYKKNHPPSLGDEVWRLERIGKDGAFHNRLTSNQINTVQDLFRLLVTDPDHLRNIFGSGMSNKTWETIIQHVMSCILDNKLYMYYNSARQVGLVFDSVYKLVGATFDGESYKSLGNLTTPQMILVESLKHHAYRNLNEIVEIDCPSVDASSVVLPLEGSYFPGLSLDSQFPEFSITYQGHLATQTGLNTPINAPYMAADTGLFEEVSVMQGCCPVQVFSSLQRNSFKMKGPSDPFLEDLLHWDSGDETGIGFVSTLPDIRFHVTRSSRPKLGWSKIRAAVKWVKFWRGLAARRRARILQLGY